MSNINENKKIDLDELENVNGGGLGVKVDKSQPGWYYHVSCEALGQYMFAEGGPYSTRGQAEQQAAVAKRFFNLAIQDVDVVIEEVK